MITQIIYGVITIILLIKTIVLIILTKKLLRRDTKAVILRKDLDDKLITINPNEKSFNHDKKKYLTPKEEKGYVAIARKKYCFYEEGNPEPKNLYEEGKPIINAQSFYEVVETNALSLLNKSTSGLGDFDIKKILLIGGGLIIVYMLFM